jgi:DNA-binding response OmpR family regulator
MNPIRLLLVEDDAVSRGFLTLALQSMPGTVVDTANNAAQALAHAREGSHALWLLDANLPDASGEQLLAALRELRPDVPALCLTAEMEPERLDRLRAAGFVEVLQKPLAIATLHASVRRMLGKQHPAAEGGMVWDDAQALRALGGNVAAMQAMRGLFIAELPIQSAAILRAVAAGDADATRAELHRLKASCGFVGSLRLLDAVRALADAPDDPRCAERFRAEVVAVLDAAQSRS